MGKFLDELASQYQYPSEAYEEDDFDAPDDTDNFLSDELAEDVKAAMLAVEEYNAKHSSLDNGYEPDEEPQPEPVEVRASSVPAGKAPQRLKIEAATPSVHEAAAHQLRGILLAAGGSLPARDALGELYWFGYDYKPSTWAMKRVRELAGIETSRSSKGRPAMWYLARQN